MPLLAHMGDFHLLFFASFLAHSVLGLAPISDVSLPIGDIRALQRPETCVEDVGTFCARPLFDQIIQNAQSAIQ
jgi:hypothetical protein